MNKAKTFVRIATAMIPLLVLLSPAAAQMELESISVYNVTGETGEERYTGGELLVSGKNTTFLVNQTRDSEDYRFVFRVSSAQDRTFQGEDALYHENLSTSWSINRTWYNVSGTEYEGGSFNDGRVSWETSQGGTLAAGENLYAKYIVEVDQGESETFDQRFVANDTSENTWTQDEHILDLNRLGYLDLTLEDPADETVLTQNKTFIINSTVECLAGECGEISSSPRYNESSTADTIIPGDSGQPFYTLDSNSTCSLDAGESCYVSWDVNATADDSTSHLLDVNASSSYSEIEEAETLDSEVEVKQAVMMNLSWNTVDFGLLDPGDENKSAIGNDDLAYNVSIIENSNDADIWVKGSDLVSEHGSEYSIEIENMSYSLENLESSSSPVNHTYDLVESAVSAETVLNTFYWLDVPTGIIKGDYNGSITYKANLSQ